MKWTNREIFKWRGSYSVEAKGICVSTFHISSCWFSENEKSVFNCAPTQIIERVSSTQLIVCGSPLIYWHRDPCNRWKSIAQQILSTEEMKIYNFLKINFLVIRSNTIENLFKMFKSYFFIGFCWTIGKEIYSSLDSRN